MLTTTQKMIFNSMLRGATAVTKRHVEQNIIKTHPLHLFRIIQDVDRYQDFLPLCRYSKIIRRSADGRSFDGKLIVGSPPLFSEEYTSRVTVVPETLTIQAESIESKNFDSLRSRWTLGEVDGSDHDMFCCSIDFEVEMTVSDPMIVAVLDQVLQEVAGRQVDAFDKRCQELPLPYDLIEAAKLLKQ